MFVCSGVFTGSVALTVLNLSYNLLAKGAALVALQALRDSLTKLSLANNPLGDLCPQLSKLQPYGKRNIVNRKSYLQR